MIYYYYHLFGFRPKQRLQDTKSINFRCESGAIFLRLSAIKTHKYLFIKYLCVLKLYVLPKIFGRAASLRSRRAIRSITFAPLARRYGGSATIPLARGG
jgi:hypothetical protein